MVRLTPSKNTGYDRITRISGWRNHFMDRHEKLLTQRAGRGWRQVTWRRKHMELDKEEYYLLSYFLYTLMTWLRKQKDFSGSTRPQALRTNAIKVKTDKQEGDVRCRICRDREETVAHLTSECSKLAQLEYKKRHDRVAGIMQWSLCEMYDLLQLEQWYRHMAEPVAEMEKDKILWDVSTRQTTRFNTDDQIL